MKSNDSERKQIIELIKKEVIPAIGCTEPIAVALCVAKATELLEDTPQHIEVLLSANVLKNAMGVGIPGTGMTGLPIAVALGALVGKSSYGLEVLKDVSSDDVEEGRKLIAEKVIQIALKRGVIPKLYIEVICTAGHNQARAIIAIDHTRFIHLSKNDTIILNQEINEARHGEDEGEIKLNLQKVYDFSMQTPLEDLSFILESGEMNLRAAEISLKGNYGHSLGKILTSFNERELIGDNPMSDMLAYTSAACDARMAGAMIPVMSNSGSGNQGIAATVPVIVYAQKRNKTEEQLIRALTLSNLVVIYIKQHLGRLSALCGCVVASTGSSCGLTYLMGGEYPEVSYAVKNMIANLTGMICDGAKPSCSMKISSGTSTAVLSALLAMEHKSVSSVEGIIDENVDRCVMNLARIGSDGMEKTDEVVLEIMTSKHG